MEWYIGLIVLGVIASFIWNDFLPAMWGGSWALRIGTGLFIAMVIAGINDQKELVMALLWSLFAFFVGTLAWRGFQAWQEDKKRGL